MRENAIALTGTSKRTNTDMVSLSLNQVLMRSVNTTVTSLLPVLSLLFIGSYLMGAVVLQEFGIALAVGLLSGAYSSIMVAAPLVAKIKEREPRNRELAARVEARQGPIDSPVAASVPAGASVTSPSGTARAPELSGRAIPPRPRKKGKKR
jgi:preprotein translocase subunit SecF